jgi:O-glycosyl hydrolase
MSKNKFLMIPALLLVFALSFISCPDEGEEEEGEEARGGPGFLERGPVFSLQPNSSNYLTGSTVAKLTVEVKDPEDKATLTLQWYSNAEFKNTGGTAIEGETTKEYTPDITEGQMSYYLVATNPDNGRALPSNPARIKFVDSFTTPTQNINVNLDKKQYVRGFGGMSNGFGIGSPARYMEMKDIHSMFGPEPEQLGLNILRINLFPQPLDDILRGVYHGQMGNSIYCDIVAKVNEYGGYVLASPWSPPEEWKSNFSLNGGGYLSTWAYKDYAAYLKKWCEDMADKGAPIYAVSIQNEPTVQVSYDGCDWTPLQQLNFFKTPAVGGKFTTGVPGYGAGKPLTSVKLMTGEPHNDITFNSLLLNDATARNYVDIVGYHIYGSLNSRYGLALDAPLYYETWMTEHNINSGSEATYPNDSTWNLIWAFVREVHHCIANNDSSAFIWWYAKRFYSFIGDNYANTVNGSILPRGHAMSHYAKFASDTVRVTTTHTGIPAPSGTPAVGLYSSAYLRESRAADVPENPAVPMTKVMANEDSISLVFYDSRTTTGEPTPLRINLPDGWGPAKFVYGIISDPVKRREPLLIVLNPDGKSADIEMTPNTMVSVRFVK